VIVPLATAPLAGPDGLGMDGQQFLVALVLAAVAGTSGFTTPAAHRGRPATTATGST
jgi:hypothetical protein